MSNGRFIAHPGQTLENHLLGVGEKAGGFATKIGLREQGELIGLLHDLGKYDMYRYGKNLVGPRKAAAKACWIVKTWDWKTRPLFHLPACLSIPMTAAWE